MFDHFLEVRFSVFPYQHLTKLSDTLALIKLHK